MKTLLLTAMLLSPQGGEHEKGLEHYRGKRHAEAAAAFAAAIASEGDSAELQYNLALALWRSGDRAGAETAVEKYAAMAGAARPDLHKGLLGALRYDESRTLAADADALAGGSVPLAPRGSAPAAGADPAPPPPPPDPLPMLEQALQKAEQAKNYFVQGAVAAPSPELLRNTERTLRWIDELKKKIEELKKQREQQPKDDPQQDGKDESEPKQEDGKQEKDEPQQEGQKKPGEQPQKPEDKKGEEPKQGEPQQGEGEQKPEPKPGDPPPAGQQPPPASPEPGKPEDKAPGEPQPGEPPPEPKAQDDKARRDAPGETEAGKELTPEQTQRLLEELQKLDQRLKEFRARSTTGRRPVERDW